MEGSPSSRAGQSSGMEGLQDLVDEMEHLLQATPAQPSSTGSRPAQHNPVPTEQQQQQGRPAYKDSTGPTALRPLRCALSCGALSPS